MHWCYHNRVCRNACCKRLLLSGDVPNSSLDPWQRPNIIVVVTDDQGWDDIGLHNPKYVNTPNLDKFIQGGTFYSNFYTNAQCAQTREFVVGSNLHSAAAAGL